MKKLNTKDWAFISGAVLIWAIVIFIKQKTDPLPMYNYIIRSVLLLVFIVIALIYIKVKNDKKKK